MVIVVERDAAFRVMRHQAVKHDVRHPRAAVKVRFEIDRRFYGDHRVIGGDDVLDPARHLRPDTDACS
jgi:hypothetical protein